MVILAKGRVRVVDRLETLCRPASPIWQVRVLGQPDRLVDRLRLERVEARAEPDGSLSVAAPDGAVIPRLWDWAREAQVGIRSLVPAKNSLEQIFLDAVREDTHADS